MMIGRLLALFKLVARHLILIDSWCRRCGRAVRDYGAPDVIWSSVKPLIPFGGNTLCFECFVDLSRVVGWKFSCWRLVPLDDERSMLDGATSPDSPSGPPPPHAAS